MVNKIQVPTIPAATANVTIADGGQMSSNVIVPAAVWSDQGHVFTTDLRVPRLGCYDVILGMKWLESLGSMWIDWTKKVFRFRHQGRHITLHGVKDVVSSCSEITALQLATMMQTGAVAQIIQLDTVQEGQQALADLPSEVNFFFGHIQRQIL